ncbi:MAG: hypothetical protein KAS32_06775, partial [Candidatus Peribacteraceae bacterium]|nr:hypothetical protein [Candidatus Peribacteraceae bacterium]
GTNGEWTLLSDDALGGYYHLGLTSYVWNEFTGTEWIFTEPVPNLNYFITFFAAVNGEASNNIVKIVGQGAYKDRNAARDAVETELLRLNLEGLPSPEFMFIGAIIINGNNGETQDIGGGTLIYDLRGTTGGAASSSPSSSYASSIITDTTNFNNNLSPADTNVQLALDTLDDLIASGGGASFDWSTVSINTLSVKDNGYFVNTSGGIVSITLPAVAVEGDTIAVCDYDGSFGTNNCTLNRNGHNIMGLAEDFVCNISYMGLQIVYSDVTQGWQITLTADGPGKISTPAVVSVSGTIDEIDVDNSDPINPIVSISPNLDISGNGTPPPQIVSDDFLIEAGGTINYMCDVSLSAITATFPDNPSIGDMVYIGDYEGSCSDSHSIYMTSVSEKIYTSNDDFRITASNSCLVWQYIDVLVGWKIVDGIGEDGNYTPDETLDEVIILPVGTHGAGSHNLPGGYSWTDFESVEWGMNISTTLRATGQIVKEFIADRPTTFDAQIYSATSGTNYWTTLTATGSSSFDITVLSSTVTYIKGYIKKYGTRNLSKTVSVNGGVDLVVDSQYEIDIATELGTDYLNRDLIVVAEIYNNSGTGTAAWADPGWVWDRNGTKATVIDDKIVVQTGANAVSAKATHSGSGLGNTAVILSAPARV